MKLMNIFITRDNQKFGPYTVEQVRIYLNEGYLRDDDLAWHEGATVWMPLSKLPVLTQPEPTSSFSVSTKSYNRLVALALSLLLVLMLATFIFIGIVVKKGEFTKNRSETSTPQHPCVNARQPILNIS